MKNILVITASAQSEQSISRKLGLQLSEQLATKDTLSITHRNLNTSNLPLIDADWVEATFTPKEDRNKAMQRILSLSDIYVQELINAEVIIIALPIYNFGIPAALKAYIDLIARAGVTFKYTDTGPIGLLENKVAHVIITSGGVPLNSPVDFATPHLQQVLKFIGINDINIIDASHTSPDKIVSVENRLSQMA
jgi:FMN-dependent NADH-azoreductase